MKNVFPSSKKRAQRPDEVRGEGILQMLKNAKRKRENRREMKADGEWKEYQRENKQYDRNARLKKMESKGKSETNRYKKLHEKVYNPFPENPPKRKDAISKFKQGYTDKNKGDLTEYNNEKREFYFNKGNKKVELLPSDDADRPITKGVKKRNLGKNWK